MIMLGYMFYSYFVQNTTDISIICVVPVWKVVCLYVNVNVFFEIKSEYKGMTWYLVNKGTMEMHEMKYTNVMNLIYVLTI